MQGYLKYTCIWYAIDLVCVKIKKLNPIYFIFNQEQNQQKLLSSGKKV